MRDGKKIVILIFVSYIIVTGARFVPKSHTLSTKLGIQMRKSMNITGNNIKRVFPQRICVSSARLHLTVPAYLPTLHLLLGKSGARSVKRKQKKLRIGIHKRIRAIRNPRVLPIQLAVFFSFLISIIKGFLIFLIRKNYYTCKEFQYFRCICFVKIFRYIFKQKTINGMCLICDRKKKEKKKIQGF